MAQLRVLGIRRKILLYNDYRGKIRRSKSKAFYKRLLFCGFLWECVCIVWICLHLTTTFMEQLNKQCVLILLTVTVGPFLTSASKYEEPHPLLSRAAVPILYRFVINFKPCTNSSHCCERKTRSLAVFLVARFSSS